MHDHVLHKLHIRLRPWRKRGPCRRRKRPARLSRRPRLHHSRLRRITLLCARSGAEGNRGSARCEQHATEHGEYSRRVVLPLAAKTIKPPLPCTAKYFHLDSEESLPLNTNTFMPPQNTSRKCPECQHTRAENRKTQAKFVCVQCGFSAPADFVGAVNMKEAGLALSACSQPSPAARASAGTHRSDSGAIVCLRTVGIPSVHGGEDVKEFVTELPQNPLFASELAKLGGERC